eukprot:c11913_g1_i1 orf=2-622(-)
MLNRALPSRSYGLLCLSTSTRKFASWAQPILEDLDNYSALLRSCRVLSHGQHLHLSIACDGHDTILHMQNMLLHMYSKYGSLADTCTFFAKMHTHVVFSWNIIIDAHARSGNVEVAFRIFQQMWSYEVEPNQFTLVSILAVCTNESVLVIGEHMHACIVMIECEGDVVVDTAIVNMYSKCGDLKAAIIMFEKMRTRNIYSWSAMIAA